MKFGLPNTYLCLKPGVGSPPVIRIVKLHSLITCSQQMPFTIPKLTAWSSLCGELSYWHTWEQGIVFDGNNICCCFKSKWINFWLFNICICAGGHKECTLPYTIVDETCWTHCMHSHIVPKCAGYWELHCMHSHIVPKCAGYWEFCVYSFSRISTDYFAHEVWLNNSFPAAQSGKRLKLDIYRISRIHLTVYKTARNVCTCSFSFVGKISETYH